MLGEEDDDSQTRKIVLILTAQTHTDGHDYDEREGENGEDILRRCCR